MDIHQCMTCGERWGVGTSAYGMRAEKHRQMGHQVSIGDDEVLRVQAASIGLELGASFGEPLDVYRCLDCEEIWVHGTADAYDRAVEHKGRGHLVFQGTEADMRNLKREHLSNPGPQTPNPMDENSRAGGGVIMTLTAGT